ncbi:MAG: ABC transporter permease [Anaerolineae bacterium]|jgi:ABC-2 type transport system permease protein
MGRIARIALNDIRIEFSERSTIVFFLILPLIFTAVVGSALQDQGGGSTRFPFALVDADGTDASARLVEALEASEVVDPVVLPADEAARRFADSDFPALLTIPAGFEEGLLQGTGTTVQLSVSSTDTRALTVEQAVSAAADALADAVLVASLSVAEAERIEPFPDTAAREAYYQEALEMARDRLAQPPATVTVTSAPRTRAQVASGFEQSSPGQLVTWVLITLIGAAATVVNERLSGTLRRLWVMPIRGATILLGKVSGRLALGLVQMALLVGVGALVFGVDWGRSPLALVLVLVAFGLSAVALGVALGTFARTRSQAGSLTVMFSMVMAALGGAWWPLEVTPPGYQVAVQVLPTTWAMRGLTDVIIRGQDVAGVLPEVGVLLGFAALFFVVGVWRFRYE